MVTLYHHFRETTCHHVAMFSIVAILNICAEKKDGIRYHRSLSFTWMTLLRIFNIRNRECKKAIPTFRDDCLDDSVSLIISQGAGCLIVSFSVLFCSFQINIQPYCTASVPESTKKPPQHFRVAAWTIPS